MTSWTEVSRCRTGAEPPRLGGAGHSCLQEPCLEVSVGQLPPPPVPAESQQSSFGVLVAEGCGQWGPR